MLSTMQGLVMSKCENIGQCSPHSRPCPACQRTSSVGFGALGSQLLSCFGWWHLCRKVRWGHSKYQQDKWDGMVWKAQELRQWEKQWTEAVSVECAAVRTWPSLHISLYTIHRSKGRNCLAKKTVHRQKTGPYTLPSSHESGQKLITSIVVMPQMAAAKKYRLPSLSLRFIRPWQYIDCSDETSLPLGATNFLQEHGTIQFETGDNSCRCQMNQLWSIIKQ